MDGERGPPGEDGERGEVGESGPGRRGPPVSDHVHSFSFALVY